MAILVSILFSLLIGFIMGFFYHLRLQNKISKQHISLIRKTITTYLNECDRISYDRYILTKGKGEILAARIMLALNKLK